MNDDKMVQSLSDKITYLLEIVSKINTNVEYLRHYQNETEKRLKELSDNYSDLKTEIAVIKREIDKVEKLEKNQITISGELSKIKDTAYSNKSKWDKIGEFSYKLLVLVVGAIILYKLGIKQ